jgi:hypothetical protein
MERIKPPFWVVIVRVLGVVVAVTLLFVLIDGYSDLPRWGLPLYLTACLPVLVPWRFVVSTAFRWPLFAVLCAGVAIAVYTAVDFCIKYYTGDLPPLLVVTGGVVAIACIMALQIPAVLILGRRKSAVSRQDLDPQSIEKV